MNLTAQNICYRINDAEPVSDASLQLQTGKLTGLIGPNGAGKSSLMRVLAGLAEPAKGDVRLDGASLPDMPAKQRGKAIAYMPQDGVIHWPLRARRLVSLGRLPHLAPFERPSAQDRAKVDEALQATDALHLADRVATSLSGGERARVLLARALATEASILLVDEPVAALDPKHQKSTMELLKTLAEQGRTVLIILHDLTLAARYCDELVLMDQGRTLVQGTPTEVLTDENLHATYGIEVHRWTDGDTMLVVPK